MQVGSSAGTPLVNIIQTEQESLEAQLAANRVNNALKANKSGSQAQLMQADFINLLTTQMKYQDPLSPMDNQEWISQMANFTSLQTSLETNTKLDGLSMGLHQIAALDLTGREVMYLDERTQSYQQGKVDSLVVSAGTPYAVINDGQHTIGSIQQVLARDPRDGVTE